MSEHPKNDAADTSNTPSPSFMDVFAIQIAARLVGSQHLLNQFSSESPLFFRAYWRSPLLIDAVFAGPKASSSFPKATTRQPDDYWNIVFIDVALECDRSNHKVSVKFGVMLQQQSKQECVYMTSSPLSLSQLSSHCESIGIDIESTPPDAIARTMGTALIGFVGQTVKIELVDDGVNMKSPVDLDYRGTCTYSLSVSLHYKDLQETGSLKLSSDSFCYLNASTSFMMLYNVESKDERVAAESEVDESKEAAASLTASFEQWLKTPAPTVKERSKAFVEPAVESTTQGDSASTKLVAAARQVGGAENVANGSHSSAATGKETAHTNTTTSTASTVSATAATDASNANKAPKEQEPKKPAPVMKRPHAGYARVGSKKKKRGKLGFANANK